MVRPGDRVSERYEVLEQLAIGGMGTLWRARHVELEVDVVLKVIASDAASPVLLKRFKREAQAAARLRSPNIVQVQDYGVFEGQPYLAMELLRGEDLATRLKRVATLTPAACLEVLEGVGRAMETAHAAGIVHRDLKPANIFLERVGDSDIVKVLDFGVAKEVAKSTDAMATTGASVVGSPAYMSPEQIWGEAVGPRADVWAMAVVAFELLTGHCPFADESLAKVFDRILRAPLPNARDYAAELSPAFDDFFRRGLARAQDERFQSATELVNAFSRATRGELAPSNQRATRHAPEHYRAVWLVGAALLVGILVTIALLFHAKSEPRPKPFEAEAAQLAASPPPAASPQLAASPPAPRQATSVERARAPTRTTPSTATKPSRAANEPATTTPAPQLDPQFGLPLPR